MGGPAETSRRLGHECVGCRPTALRQLSQLLERRATSCRVVRQPRELARNAFLSLRLHLLVIRHPERQRRVRRRPLRHRRRRRRRRRRPTVEANTFDHRLRINHSRAPTADQHDSPEHTVTYDRDCHVARGRVGKYDVGRRHPVARLAASWRSAHEPEALRHSPSRPRHSTRTDFAFCSWRAFTDASYARLIRRTECTSGSSTIKPAGSAPTSHVLPSHSAFSGCAQSHPPASKSPFRQARHASPAPQSLPSLAFRDACTRLTADVGISFAANSPSPKGLLSSGAAFDPFEMVLVTLVFVTRCCSSTSPVPSVSEDSESARRPASSPGTDGGGNGGDGPSGGAGGNSAAAETAAKAAATAAAAAAGVSTAALVAQMARVTREAVAA